MLQSIHSLKPIEQGGPIARKGFDFQDHVAAGFCLEMLKNTELKEVWCETIDDITLIWSIEGVEVVEFIQVKNYQLGQLWSVSKICERDNKKPGTSVVERSFLNDRCSEDCIFRLVTSENVNKELSLLQKKRKNQLRLSAVSQKENLKDSISKKIGSITSVKGHGVGYWIDNMLWDVRYSKESLINANNLVLENILWTKNEMLAPDQRGVLYEKLLGKTRAAAVAEYDLNPERKKIRQGDLHQWLEKQIEESHNPALIGPEATLVKKMINAGLQDEIQDALQCRRDYIQRVRVSEYLQLNKPIDREVSTKLRMLRSGLMSGQLDESGAEFHHRCLVELDSMYKYLNGKKLSLSDLHGSMYDQTARCVHRFIRNDCL